MPQNSRSLEQVVPVGLSRWIAVALMIGVGAGTGCGSVSQKSDAGATDTGGTGGSTPSGSGGAPVDADSDVRVDARPADANDAGAPHDAPDVTDASPDAGACARPRTCAVIHACDSSIASGNYMIFPDGAADAGLLVHCDMETAGGGWTVIFLANAVNLGAANIDYTVPTQSLRDGAQEALMAFRNLNLNMVASDWASFGLPATWRTKNPLSVAPFEDLSVSASVNGSLPAVALLRYGQANFSQLCSDPWISGAGVQAIYGRVCLQGTAAAFYSGFAADGTVSTAPSDFCSTSSQNYAARACSDTARFSIAVR